MLNTSTSPRLDKFEGDKLKWTTDIESKIKTPSIKTTESSSKTEAHQNKPIQARFDFSGAVIPPGAVRDSHSGLHHHGEEPERAGYSIGELFHLARSSNQSQRRIALATLASSLTQSRLGCHVNQLAPSDSPSLVWSTLAPSQSSVSDDNSKNQGGGQAGIIFLLRWALDEAATCLASSHGNSIASVDTSTAVPAGMSLALICESLHALASLLCDSRSEAFLYHAHDWLLSLVNQQPPLCYIRPSTQQDLDRSSSTSISSDDNDLDDSQLAQSDPVKFLFTRTRLASRIAWLLTDRKLVLTADASGLYLPAILTRGLRHSKQLVYQIFSTPNLIRSLVDTYLVPISMATAASHHGDRPIQLTISSPQAFSPPLFTLLHVFNTLGQTSTTFLLSLVNDYAMFDRCLSYLGIVDRKSADSISSPEKIATKSPTSSLIGDLTRHLPGELPLAMCIHLQLQSLRFLTTCLVTSNTTANSTNQHQQRSQPPRRAIEMINRHLSTLFQLGSSCLTALSTSLDHQKSSTFGDIDLLTLLTSAWINFLTNCLTALTDKNLPPMDQSAPPRSLLTNQASHLIGWCSQLINRFSQLFTILHNNFTDWFKFEVKFNASGLDTSLLVVCINASLRLLDVKSNRLSDVCRQPYITQLDDFWITTLFPLVSSPSWTGLLNRFRFYQSVLTGVPEFFADVEVVVAGDDTITQVEPTNDQNESPIDPTNLDPSTTIDPILLSDPLSLTPCNLPDYGSVSCFRYQLTSRQLCTLWWPRYHQRTSSSSNPIDLLDYRPKRLSLLALAACSIGLLESLVVQARLHHYHNGNCLQTNCLTTPFLVDWIRQFSSVCISHPADNDHAILIKSIEVDLMARALLCLGKLFHDKTYFSDELAASLISTGTRFGGKGNYLHRATHRLLPMIRVGGPLSSTSSGACNNNSLLTDKLLSEIIFNHSIVSWNYKLTSPLGESAMARLAADLGKLYSQRFLSSRRRQRIQTINQSKQQLSDKIIIHKLLPLPLGFTRGATALSTIAEDAVADHDQDSFQNDNDLDSAVLTRLLPALHATSDGQLPSLTDQLIPFDWPYLPLIAHYVDVKQRVAKASEEQRQACTTITDDLTAGLQYLVLLGEVEVGPVRHLSSFGRIGRLILGSLACSEAGGLGFDPSGRYLAQLLISSSDDLDVNHHDATSKDSNQLPSWLPSFYDSYADLLTHYAALSYNSTVLGNLVLWPCQQACHFKYRRALWGEHQEALTALRLSPAHLLIPLESFLAKEEDNESLLRLYFAGLWSGLVRLDRQPLLFLIALHHLNRYMYSTPLPVDSQSSDKDAGKRKDSLLHQVARLIRMTTSTSSTTNVSPSNRFSSMTMSSAKVDLIQLLKLYKQTKSPSCTASPATMPLTASSLPLQSQVPASDKETGLLPLAKSLGMQFYSEDKNENVTSTPLSANRRRRWQQLLVEL